VSDLDGEDAKLVVLARAARGRAYTPHGQGRIEGAAVRDTDGRTYTAATVEHRNPALTTSALRGALAAAASSGARAFEAAVVVTDVSAGCAEDVEALREFGPGVALILAGTDGDLLSTQST
jgi:cytidine deaminase